MVEASTGASCARGAASLLDKLWLPSVPSRPASCLRRKRRAPIQATTGEGLITMVGAFQRRRVLALRSWPVRRRCRRRRDRDRKGLARLRGHPDIFPPTPSGRSKELVSPHPHPSIRPEAVIPKHPLELCRAFTGNRSTHDLPELLLFSATAVHAGSIALPQRRARSGGSFVSRTP